MCLHTYLIDLKYLRPGEEHNYICPIVFFDLTGYFFYTGYNKDGKKKFFVHFAAGNIILHSFSAQRVGVLREKHFILANYFILAL